MGRTKDQDVGQLAVVLQAAAECYEEAGLLDEGEVGQVRGGMREGAWLWEISTFCPALFGSVSTAWSARPFHLFLISFFRSLILRLSVGPFP